MFETAVITMALVRRHHMSRKCALDPRKRYDMTLYLRNPLCFEWKRNPTSLSIESMFNSSICEHL